VGYSCAGEFLLADTPEEPGCILLDMSMPGPSGLDLLNALAARNASLPVIVVTSMVDVSTSVRALQCGAIDYLTKPVQTEALLQSVHDAIALDTQRRAIRSRIGEARQRYARLTRRERSVFHGIVAGKLNKQIAADLGTCERTIKAHRARVMTKLRVNSLADLVRSAMLLDKSTQPPPTLREQRSLRKGASMSAPCTH
jgi:FixJ family two-component response regulator